MTVQSRGTVGAGTVYMNNAVLPPGGASFPSFIIVNRWRCDIYTPNQSQGISTGKCTFGATTEGPHELCNMAR